MVCVVFDTSFLLNSLRAKINPFSELKKQLGHVKFILPLPVVRELEGLSKGELLAKLVLDLLKKTEYWTVESERTADKAVVEIAQELQCLLATTDKEVRQSAEKLGIRQITLRQGKYIQLPD